MSGLGPRCVAHDRQSDLHLPATDFKSRAFAQPARAGTDILLGEGIARPMATVFAPTVSEVHDRTAGNLACVTRALTPLSDRSPSA